MDNLGDLAEIIILKAQNKIMKDALLKINSQDNYKIEREKAVQDSLIRKWTRDGANYMYLKAWNLKAYIAERALEDVNRIGTKE